MFNQSALANICSPLGGRALGYAPGDSYDAGTAIAGRYGASCSNFFLTFHVAAELLVDSTTTLSKVAVCRSRTRGSATTTTSLRSRTARTSALSVSVRLAKIRIVNAVLPTQIHVLLILVVCEYGNPLRIGEDWQRCETSADCPSSHQCESAHKVCCPTARKWP